MNEEHKIIAIRKRDISQAHEAFVSLMDRTENILNNESQIHPEYYKRLTSSTLEICAVEKIRLACADSPFDANEVRLVSGQKFPDIVASEYYGIEVKSTKNDHWTSTGSSIVETTRIESVDDIYMLFGKLGGLVPQFRCRPYQDVLYDIAITHSPRYLINMELGKGDTIFSKMGTTYDTFRKAADNIALVRKYYREKAQKQKRQEMPWWITNENIDKTYSFNIRLWNSLEIAEKRELQAKCMILFPEALNPARSNKKYNNTTLWLCSYNQVVNPNIRDLYSAGGKITHVNGKRLAIPVSQVFHIIVDYADEIKALLLHPSDELYALIKEYNSELLKNDNLFEGWVKQCQQFAEASNVPLKNWISNKPAFLYSK
jgi:hypothetical protein